MGTKHVCAALLAILLLLYLAKHKNVNAGTGTGPTGNYVATPTTRYPLSWKLGLAQTVKGGEPAYTGGREQITFVAIGTRSSQEHL